MHRLGLWNNKVWLVATGSKAGCLTRDIGLCVECPLWGSFKGILDRIYACFGENHGKLRTARLTSATGLNLSPPVYQLLKAEPLSHWGAAAAHSIVLSSWPEGQGSRLGWRKLSCTLKAPGICEIRRGCNVLQVPIQIIPPEVPKRGSHPLRGGSKLRWHVSE